MTIPAPTVQARDLTMTFGRTRALDGVSFELAPGVTGLLGPNGAGKTTLLRVLATVSAPDAGSVLTLGLDPRRTDQRLDVRGRLGYMPQEPGFHARFTAFEFVDYVAILKEMHQRRARHEEVRRVLELVDLGAVRGKKIKTLSGGMRRRVALAQALLGAAMLATNLAVLRSYRDGAVDLYGATRLSPARRTLSHLLRCCRWSPSGGSWWSPTWPG